MGILVLLSHVLALLDVRGKGCDELRPVPREHRHLRARHEPCLCKEQRKRGHRYKPISVHDAHGPDARQQREHNNGLPQEPGDGCVRAHVGVRRL